jgi:hypothetical protein
VKNNKLKALYWILTLLILLPAAGTGIPELFFGGPETTVAAMHTLGYPLYLMKIIGFSKILGSLAITYERFPRLKEWAYAGFAIDFLGATASHILAGDARFAPVPFSCFIILMGSYFLWHRMRTRNL